MTDGSLYWTTTHARFDAPRDIATGHTAEVLHGLGFHHQPATDRHERPARALSLPVIHSWTVTVTRDGQRKSTVDIQHGLRATAATGWVLAAAALLMIALIVAGPFTGIGTDLGAAVVLLVLAAGVIDLKLTQHRHRTALRRALSPLVHKDGLTTSVREVA